MSKLIEFKPTPALAQQIGEQAAPDKEFEVLCKLRAKPNGNWCLLEVDGVAMPGYKDEAEDKTGSFARSYEKARGVV